MSKTLIDGSTHRLSLKELKDIEGNYINTATVTATVVDDDGAEVAGETWPVALAYDGNGNGTYFKDLAVLTGVGAYDQLTLRLSAVAATLSRDWECAIQVRGSEC